METTAKANYIRMSPRKVRLVANLIKGLTWEEALVQLSFSSKDAAKPIAKLLQSAMHNAEENFQLKRSNLMIAEIKVDGGPVLKRWMPRAFGRATPLRKPTSHITVTLKEILATDAATIKAAKDRKAAKKDDIIKLGDIDEIKESSSAKEEKVGEDKTKANASSKGFASKILNRRTGQK